MRPDRSRTNVRERARAVHARLGNACSPGHAGLWHPLLDRRESYEETSASAMFVFALARGIDRGWLDARASGSQPDIVFNDGGVHFDQAIPH